MMDKKPIITFDKESFDMIKDALGLKHLRCEFCGEKITKENIAGFVNAKKVFCNNTFCILEYALKNKKQGEQLIDSPQESLNRKEDKVKTDFNITLLPNLAPEDKPEPNREGFYVPSGSGDETCANCGHKKKFHFVHEGRESCWRGKMSGVQNRISCDCRKFTPKGGEDED